jgi:hypothetical protein
LVTRGILDGVQLDGVNLLPFLDGQQRSDPHEALFWRWRAEQAIRIGDWKLVRGRERKAWRLIDLASDVREANELTSKHPEKAKELLTRFAAWNSALPPVGPSFKDTTEGEEPESKLCECSPTSKAAAVSSSTNRKERNGQSMGRPVDLAQDGAFLLGPLPRPREPARLSMTKVSETSAHASRISNPSTSSIPTQSPMRPRTSRRRLRRIREPTESRIR